MLLRCGIFYNQNNYEQALYSIQYSQSTKKALQRFLYGFTEFSFSGESFEGIGKGWVSYFANRDCKNLCEQRHYHRQRVYGAFRNPNTQTTH